MSLRHGAATDIGRTRKSNQDRFLSTDRLAAVADGVGGHNAGEVASAIAIEELMRLRQAGPWASDAAGGEALRAAFLRANQRIREAAAGDEKLEGMGTTLVAVLENDDDSIHLANVGDSRAYLLRDGELSQITVDHSLVQELVDEGRLRPDEAGRHPHRSVITRALGLDATLDVDLFTYKLQPGDRLLLCSDGLSDAVDDSSIREVLLRVADPQRAAERLIDMANESGGPDNVTVIVLDTEDGGARGGGHGGSETAPARERPLRRRGRGVVLGVLAVALLAGTAAGGRALVFSRYWVGFDERDRVAVFRGVPGNVAGLHLSELVARTPISRGQVPAGYAPRLDDGVPAASLGDARRIANCAPVAFTAVSCTGAAPASASTTTLAPATSNAAATATVPNR